MQCFISVTEDVKNYLDYKYQKVFERKKVGSIGNAHKKC